MQPEDRVRLQHMPEAANAALEFMHGYLDTDVEIVWNTTVSELPRLIGQLTAALERTPTKGLDN